jgi:RHS repeat-associated protein
LTNLVDGNGHNTSWKYDEYGRMTNKTDTAGNVVFIYGYDANNRVTHPWAPAKTNTLYYYNAVGNLKDVVYSADPPISMAYDMLNRLTNMVTVGRFTNSYSYDAVGQLLSEDGPWPSDTVSCTYTNRLRTSLSLAQPSASAWTNGYLYDPAKRLTNITSQAGAFGYVYGAPSTASALVRKVTLPNSAFITNTYGSVARLLSTTLKNSQLTTLNSHEYGYNEGNQRTQQVFTAGNFVDYAYDQIGQLKTAFGKESGGVTNRWQEQLGYAYDDAGNLKFRTNNALIQAFSVNNLNELTNIARDDTFTVAGGTMGPVTSITVNGSNALLYADGSFVRANVSVTNGLNTFTAIARDNWNRSATNTVAAWLPTNAAYQYDLNGNLLTDGLRCFAWDDENQLVSVWVTNAWRSDFQYDGRMRRRVRIEFTWSGISWTPTNEVLYVYDGNLVIQERAGNNTPQVTYTRGLDLSGSFQGAGGIGGLLSRTDTTITAFYHADGNGNVTCLVGATNQVLARYHYDPFGSTLSKSGPLADANLYRFSSKEFHPNSGLIYYLYRFYDPSLQRWPNRDPIGERGSLNLFKFVANNPISATDPLGQETLALPKGTAPPAGYRLCGAIGNQLLWCKDDPKAPKWQPPKTQQPPPEEDPRTCWKDPDEAFMVLGGQPGWEAGCYGAEKACEMCCINRYADKAPEVMAACFYNCKAKWGACMQHRACPSAPTPGPTIQPEYPPRS